MIRRALLKAVAIPGYQVPFGSREMPVPRGWGTGGIQMTAAMIGPGDVLKVIDQGADDTTNAVSIRRFFAARRRRGDHRGHRRGDHHPDPPPDPGDSRCGRPDAGLPGAAARTAAAWSRARPRPGACTPRRNTACSTSRCTRTSPGTAASRHRGLPGDGRRALPDGALADPQLRQPEDAPRTRLSCSAPAARSASTRCRRTPRWEPRFRGLPLRTESFEGPARSAAAGVYLDEVVSRRRRDVRLLRHRPLRTGAGGRGRRGARVIAEQPLLRRCAARGTATAHRYGCRDVGLRSVAGRGPRRGRRVRFWQDDPARRGLPAAAPTRPSATRATARVATHWRYGLSATPARRRRRGGGPGHAQ